MRGNLTSPPLGVPKVNTNGPFLGNASPTSIGEVNCSSSSDVQFIFSVHTSCHTNNLMEALTILHDVEQCYFRGWHRIIYDSDS